MITLNIKNDIGTLCTTFFTFKEKLCAKVLNISTNLVLYMYTYKCRKENNL